MGAACVWWAQEGWAGRRFYLGTKEVFDAETFVVYQALLAFNQRQERGRQYTVFINSTAAIRRLSDDTLSPGQRFAVAAIETCARILARDNSVTIRWVPAHSGAEGNEQADRYAKEATWAGPLEAVQEGYVNETSLSHTTRVATESRAREAADWIKSHVHTGWRYRPPPGQGLRCLQLRRARKTLAGRYYLTTRRQRPTATDLECRTRINAGGALVARPSLGTIYSPDARRGPHSAGDCGK